MGVTAPLRANPYAPTPTCQPLHLKLIPPVRTQLGGALCRKSPQVNPRVVFVDRRKSVLGGSRVARITPVTPDAAVLACTYKTPVSGAVFRSMFQNDHGFLPAASL